VLDIEVVKIQFPSYELFTLHFHFQMWMSVLLIRYQMNIFILHTTVTLTATVQTPKDRSSARVIQDTLEMESRVSVDALIRLFALNQFDRQAQCNYLRV